MDTGGPDHIIGKAYSNMKSALDFIEEFGPIEGEHHKQWVLDQVVRILTRGHIESSYSPDTYQQWVRRLDSWDTGIAP
jgi:hypothetical protein